MFKAWRLIKHGGTECVKETLNTLRFQVDLNVHRLSSYRAVSTKTNRFVLAVQGQSGCQCKDQLHYGRNVHSSCM